MKDRKPVEKNRDAGPLNIEKKPRKGEHEAAALFRIFPKRGNDPGESS